MKKGEERRRKERRGVERLKFINQRKVKLQS